MVRINNMDQSLNFYCKGLGLVEKRRKEVEKGRFTLIFLAAPLVEPIANPNDNSAEIELTYNWDPETYSGGRNFGHLAFEVENIYQTCQHLQEMGIVINRPPRDGHMAFVRSPDGISIEILQAGDALAPAEPWLSMKNTGEW
ncbi:Lactoylglutathione lyase [hydrothermal vent metagenome]|uniref:Lactoylglutathione lyase n=1 Tax=hydrothermal vent metagenome TaxID=652676 RepID=A0A3B0TZ33_9ZZZZ